MKIYIILHLFSKDDHTNRMDINHTHGYIMHNGIGSCSLHVFPQSNSCRHPEIKKSPFQETQQDPLTIHPWHHHPRKSSSRRSLVKREPQVFHCWKTMPRGSSFRWTRTRALDPTDRFEVWGVWGCVWKEEHLCLGVIKTLFSCHILGWRTLVSSVFSKKSILKKLSGWWFGTFFIFPYIGNVIIPTDELIFFRGVGIPPNQLCWEFWW